jgi:hypothetical protein
LKNSSIVKQLFSGSGIISQANVFISKVNIAGSIPIRNFLRNNGSKIATFIGSGAQ